MPHPPHWGRKGGRDSFLNARSREAVWDHAKDCTPSAGRLGRSCSESGMQKGISPINNCTYPLFLSANDGYLNGNVATVVIDVAAPDIVLTDFHGDGDRLFIN